MIEKKLTSFFVALNRQVVFFLKTSRFSFNLEKCRIKKEKKKDKEIRQPHQICEPVRLKLNAT